MATGACWTSIFNWMVHKRTALRRRVLVHLLLMQLLSLSTGWREMPLQLRLAIARWRCPRVLRIPRPWLETLRSARSSPTGTFLHLLHKFEGASVGARKRRTRDGGGERERGSREKEGNSDTGTHLEYPA
eukprot:1149643-Rhodomonas_salina.1